VLAVGVVIALLPLLGVAALDWSVASMFGLYWVESATVGACHWLKLLAARGRIEDPQLERALAADGASSAEQRGQQLEASRRFQHALLPWLFLFHYGAFCAIHAAIIAFLFDGAFADLSSALGIVALVAIAVAQALDYARFRADPAVVALPRNVLFMQPYRRVVVLHVVLLLGAIPALLGSPSIAALLLTTIKLGVELAAARRRGIAAAA
jgi:hypothetical protein